MIFRTSFARVIVAGTLAAGALCAAACGSSPKADPRYPPRDVGCEVKVYRGALPPGIPHDDLGHVDSICSDLVAESDCIRELSDQACKLGGDMVYEVPVKPSQPAPDKVRFVGHVAHTHIAAPADSSGAPK